MNLHEQFKTDVASDSMFIKAQEARYKEMSCNLTPTPIITPPHFHQSTAQPCTAELGGHILRKVSLGGLVIVQASYSTLKQT